jgi:hypothetical protein
MGQRGWPRSPGEGGARGGRSQGSDRGAPLRLARNHPCEGGNQRAAVLAVAVFPALHRLAFDPDEADEVGAILALAAGDLEEEELAAWIGAKTGSRGAGP